jgi:hypothetical protein
MATDQELLDKVDARITAIVDGDDVTEMTVGDETMEFASLRELQKRREVLKRKVAATTSPAMLVAEMTHVPSVCSCSFFLSNAE